MKFKILVLLFSILWSGDFIAFAQESTAKRIDSLMETKYQAGEFNGTALVAVAGKLLYRKALGVAESERQLKADTPFYLGSLSKQFTGIAILMLQEKEKLSVDDQVVDYLPELPEFMSEVTIRHLLNHTSGLPDYYDMGMYVDSMTNDKVLEVVLDLKALDFPPGQQYAYSNTGYVLLSVLIQRVTEQSFRKFVKWEIFDPIGMEHSEIFDGTQPKLPRRARGHTNSGEPDDYKALTTGAGGIYSQIDDLFIWDQALYDDDLISPDLLSKAYTPTTLNNGKQSYYGFGWMLDAENPAIVQHSGSLAGFRTYIYRDLEKRNTIILLSNFSNDVKSIKDGIVKLVEK